MRDEESSPIKRRRAPSTSASHARPPPPAPAAADVLLPPAPVSQGTLPQVSHAILQAQGALAAAGTLVKPHYLAGSPQQHRPTFPASPAVDHQRPEQLLVHGPRLIPQMIAPILPVAPSVGQLAPFRPSIRSLQTAAMSVGPGPMRPHDHVASHLAVPPYHMTAAPSMASSIPGQFAPVSPREPDSNQTPVASPLMPVALAQPLSAMGQASAMAPGMAFATTRSFPADRSQHGPPGPALLAGAGSSPKAASSTASSVSDAQAAAEAASDLCVRRPCHGCSPSVPTRNHARNASQETSAHPHRRLVHNEINRRRTTRINDLISAPAPLRSRRLPCLPRSVD